LETAKPLLQIFRSCSLIFSHDRRLLPHTPPGCRLPLGQPPGAASLSARPPPPPGCRNHTIATRPPSSPHHPNAASSLASRPAPPRPVLGDRHPTVVAQPPLLDPRHRLITQLTPPPQPATWCPAAVALPPEGHRHPTSVSRPPEGHHAVTSAMRATALDQASRPPLSADLYIASDEVSILSNVVVGIRNLNVEMNYFDLNVGIKFI
jgi:hypothetical protein